MMDLVAGGLGELVGPRMMEAYAELVPYTVGHVVVYIVFYAVGKAIWPNHKDHWTLADLLYTVIHFAFLGYISLTGSMQCAFTLEGRWFLYTDEMGIFYKMYISRSLVHLPVMLLQDQSMKATLEMVFHHTISSVCFLGGMYNKAMGCFALLDGICEISTFFLCLVLFMKSVDLDKVLKPFFIFNGLTLWASYVFTRILLFPFWLYQFYTDVYAAPEKTWAQLNPIQRYVYPGTNVILMILSCIWFTSITRGMLKQINAFFSSGKQKAS